MKTALLYATKTGAAEEYATKIAEQLGSCDIFDISQLKSVPEGYDRIILGSGMRIGKVYKQTRNLMKKNLSTLLSKPLWIYFCGIDEEGFYKVPEANVPDELREAAQGIVFLKGKPPFEKDAERQTWFAEDAFKQFVDTVNRG